MAHVLWLSAEAKAAWKAFHHRLEPHLAPDANLGAMTDWAGKLLGAVVRLSGVLHMAEHALEPQPWTRPISRVTMERASAIGAYLIPHAQAAFALMGGDEASGGARYLLDWIVRGKRKKPESFTRYEAFCGTRGRFERPENLAAALGLLEHHHVIRPEQSKEVRKVGRPAERYLINPKLYGENAQNAEKGTAGLSAEGIDSIFDIFALGDSADDEPTGVGTTAHQARAGDCGYDPDDVESF